jgi:thiamine biosynthesis lipoprotein
MLVSCRASDAAHLARFEYARISMGVEARVALYAENESAAIDAARAAFDRIDELDRELSDYMPESELSHLSARSGGAAVEVSDDLFRVLERSIEFSRASDGAFDVSVGPLVALWRTARKSRELPTESSLDEARTHVDWKSIELDHERRTVHLARSGMRLDVGGIGKGFACDEALAVLHAHGIERCLVALAGDVRLGSAPPGRAGWSITASSGGDASEVEHHVLADCAISTSGDTEQFVEIGGARYSHIIDPRTGRALTSRIRVTVIARDGTSADALATAASVLGIDAGLDLVARFTAAEAFIESTTSNGVVRNASAGFPLPADVAVPAVN